MTKKIELNTFKMPFKIHQDSEYKHHLFNKLDEYLTNIQGRKLVDSEVYENTVNNVENIKNALECYYRADLSQAQKLISEIIERYKMNDFIVTNLDRSPAFRGLTRRLYENDPHEFPYNIPLACKELNFFKARIGTAEYEREDFLHIPFNKRGLVSTQRFSIAGVPCMYFGMTSYVCWLELDKPDDRNFNVASYKLNSDLKILNMAIPQMQLNGLSNSIFQQSDIEVHGLIEFFPLIIATSYKVAEENRKFRSEYIISQLVMQCLAEHGIDGIAYISKRVDSDVKNYIYAANIAIPMKQGDDAQLYSDFAQSIELTKPINLAAYYQYRKTPASGNAQSFANVWNDGQTISYLGRPTNYGELKLSEFDNFLYSKEHKRPSF